MKPGALIICLLFLPLLLPCRAFAQRGVEVKPIDGGFIHTLPRNVVTSLFTVTNTESESIEFTSSLELPEGWSMITNDFIFTIHPGESQTRLLSFFVPQTATAGLYEIPCRVTARKFPSISDVYTLYVKVKAITDISFQVLNGPSFVIAGNEYQVDGLISNKSNQPVDLKIEARSSQGFFYNMDSAELHLKPAESKPISIRVLSNADVKSKVVDQLRITVRSIKDPDVTAEAKHRVDVIPRISGSNDVYHRLPVRLKFTNIDTKEGSWASGFQTEVSGSGYLDERKKNYLSFLMKAPDQSSMALFGQYDEYHVQYYTEKYDVGAGDLNFSLSPLTESNFSARGIRAKARTDRLVFGGYSGQTRLTPDTEKQTAATLGVRLKNENLLSLNYLNKCLEEDDSQIWSINSDISTGDDTYISVEYAGSSDTNYSNAFFADFLQNKNLYTLKLKGIYSNPNFQGYHKDQKFFSMTASYDVTKSFRISGDFVYDRKNLDLNPDNGSAPERAFHQVRMNYTTPSRTSFFIDWIKESRRDRQMGPKFDFQENSARIGTNFNCRKFSVNIMAEAGMTENKLTGSTSSFQRYTFSSTYLYNSRHSGNGYIEYDTSNDYEGMDRQKITYGLNIISKLGESSAMAISTQSSRQFDLEKETDHNFKVSFDHTLSSQWKLLNQSIINADIWKSKSTSVNRPEATSAKLSWTVPLYMPVCRKKDFGSIKGKVYDQTTLNPIADVIIKIDGQIAVTDKNGEFFFPNLPAGPVYLSANTANIKRNRVFYDKMPMQIMIKSGDTVTLDLPVIEPASFSGELNIYDFNTPISGFNISDKPSNPEQTDASVKEDADEDEFVKSGAIPNALIEMIQGAQITRRLTDQKGHFSFDALVPGRYILKIKGGQIPEYHRLEKEEFEVELTRNEHKKMEIKVLPVKRTLKMLPSAPLIIEEGK